MQYVGSGQPARLPRFQRAARLSQPARNVAGHGKCRLDGAAVETAAGTVYFGLDVFTASGDTTAPKESAHADDFPKSATASFALTAPVGSIIVTSTPDGARIFLDREDTGEVANAALTVTKEVGSRSVSARRLGMEWLAGTTSPINLRGGSRRGFIGRRDPIRSSQWGSAPRGRS